MRQGGEKRQQQNGREIIGLGIKPILRRSFGGSLCFLPNFASQRD
jgi:hypothetical protein